MATWKLQLSDHPATQKFQQHNHCAIVDERGNGTTTNDVGHYHKISNNQVWQDPNDGHAHVYVGGPNSQVLPCQREQVVSGRSDCNCNK